MRGFAGLVLGVHLGNRQRLLSHLLPATDREMGTPAFRDRAESTSMRGFTTVLTHTSVLRLLRPRHRLKVCKVHAACQRPGCCAFPGTLHHTS
jgi:hypothetical protein